jgi:hypothetical protein
MNITIYGWSTSEASPQTAEVRTWSSASRSGRSAIRASSLRDPRSARPTAAVRCAKVRPASRPAGHSESGWSDNVSANVERTADSTSSSENLTQTSRSRRPRIPTPLPRRRSEPVAPDGAVPGRGDVSTGRKHPALAGPRGGRPMVLVGTRCLRPPLRATGWRCWNASWVGTPYDPGRDEVSASSTQRCDVGMSVRQPSLDAEGRLHSSA